MRRGKGEARRSRGGSTEGAGPSRVREGEGERHGQTDGEERACDWVRGQMDGQTGRWIDGWMEGGRDGWMDGWRDGWMEGWREG